MKLSTGRGKLHLGLKKLKIRWEQARTQWTDHTADEFEENHLQAWEPKLQATLRGIEQLSEVLGKAEQECSDR